MPIASAGPNGRSARSSASSSTSPEEQGRLHLVLRRIRGASKALFGACARANAIASFENKCRNGKFVAFRHVLTSRGGIPRRGERRDTRGESGFETECSPFQRETLLGGSKGSGRRWQDVPHVCVCLFSEVVADREAHGSWRIPRFG